MKRFRVVTLGCRTNQYESQGYLDQLRYLGYLPAQAGEEAELCIVNTCTVTDGADASSRHQIRQIAQQNKKARLVVTGCMAESAPDAIHAIDDRIQIIGNLDKEKLINALFPDIEELPEFRIERFEGRTRAFVKVQDGCNSFCTYCIIPYVRGRSRSKKLSEVLEEIRSLAANGYKEIVLTGINIGDYEDPNTGQRLAQLVHEVDRQESIERIRISSIDPDEVDDELTRAVLYGHHTCNSLHLVLQSGSNIVLKRMNRKYTRQIFLDVVTKLTSLDPNFTITTDVIVGFPGETELDFEETLEIIRKVKFAKVHMFPYSIRTRTRAALYPNPVPSEMIHQRKNRLLRLSEQMTFELRERFVGKVMDVLLEEGDDEFLFGHTTNFLRVRVPKDDRTANQLVRVELLANEPDGLRGKIL